MHSFVCDFPKKVLCEFAVVCYNGYRTNELFLRGAAAMQMRMTYKYKLYYNKQNRQNLKLSLLTF